MSSGDIQHEERTIYVVIVLVCAPIVAVALISGDVFDTGSTISLLLLVIALIGLVGLRRSPRLPTVRIHGGPPWHSDRRSDRNSGRQQQYSDGSDASPSDRARTRPS